MMITKILSRHSFYNRFSIRSYGKSKNHPLQRTLDIISKEMPMMFNKKKQTIYPEHADVVIIGGGFIGSATAYCLKKRATHGLTVVVLEKDLTYTNTQNKLSLDTLTQHFSLPENIFLAQNGADFIRNVKENLGTKVDVQYAPTGSIVLASEKYADKLEYNVAIQKEYGLKTELLTPANIKDRFPWLNTEDIKLGCMTVESEGTFNSWELLKGLIQKSQELGAIYVNAEVVGFELEKQRDVLMEGVSPGSFERINRVIYKTSENEEYSIKFAGCILSAGHESRDIAKLAKVGTGDGLLSIPLPVEKREYDVYSLKDKALETGLYTPHIMDTTGLWLRRNGLENNLLFGQTPLMSSDSQQTSESEYFNNIIKPSLDNRFPNFSDAQIKQLSKEYVDCNVFDDTGILGPHPYHNNLYIAAGFGRLGCQHALGIGRAIAELIIDSHFTTIDLTRFGLDRLLTGQPLLEFNMY